MVRVGSMRMRMKVTIRRHFGPGLFADTAAASSSCIGKASLFAAHG